MYNSSDIYVFDDSLQALDIKVSNYIMEHCFLNFLKNKTRILLTNSLRGLQHVDRIIYMENGEILDSGSFEYMKKKYFYLDISPDEKKDQKQDIIDEDAIGKLEIYNKVSDLHGQR